MPIAETGQDTYWLIDGTIADGLVGPTPNTTRGETIRLEFLFYESDNSGTAYDTRYRGIRNYLEFASERSVRFGTTDRGVPWFRERLPSAATESTLLVSVETGADVVDGVELWALIVGGEDRSRPISDMRRLELEFFVLAEKADYADKTAVRNDLESEVV